MPRHEEKRGVLGAVRAHWRAVLGELLATALLILLGLGSCLPGVAVVETVVKPGVTAVEAALNGLNATSPLTRHELKAVPQPLTHPALAFGFVVLCNVEVFGPVSGAHMNPAVTLATVLAGRFKPLLAVFYVLAQMFGAILGYAALQALAHADLLGLEPRMAMTMPAEGVSPAAAAVFEALMTGVLVLLCCAMWTAPPGDRTASLKIGLTISGLIYAGGAMTGASLNPARSFAPALLNGNWQHQWVYWVGPLGGAVLCTLLHRLVLMPGAHAAPAREPEPAEELPLADKTSC